MGLTPKQKQVLDFLENYRKKHGYLPTQAEIATHFGFRSLGTVQDYLKALESQGLIARTWNARRSTQVLQPTITTPPSILASTLGQMPAAMTSLERLPAGTGAVLPLNKTLSKKKRKQDPEFGQILELPILGKVAAGRPILAVETLESIEVPRHLLKKSGEHFVLKVMGDSMIDEGIWDGDYVIIRKQNRAEEGEVVVALIENEATIKRLSQNKKNIIELLSANPKYPPIRVDPASHFEIQGILSGVMRKV